MPNVIIIIVITFITVIITAIILTISITTIIISAIYIIIIDKDGDCGKNQVAWRKDIAAKYERSI